MRAHQTDLLKTQEENEKAYKEYEQQTFLPVNPLQEKHNVENPTLTAREFEIMHMILSGLEIPDVASKIYLSIAGVKWRLTQVYWKFNVENRLQLIEKASTTGLQFFSETGIKHTFHNSVNLQAHLKTDELK